MIESLEPSSELLLFYEVEWCLWLKGINEYKNPFLGFLVLLGTT